MKSGVVGCIDSVKGGIRTTFESTPDLPLNKVVLTMKGGKKGLIQNSHNICAKRSRATGRFSAQNGRKSTLHPVVRAQCKKKHKRRVKHSFHRRSHG